MPRAPHRRCTVCHGGHRASPCWSTRAMSCTEPPTFPLPLEGSYPALIAQSDNKANNKEIIKASRATPATEPQMIFFLRDGGG